MIIAAPLAGGPTTPQLVAAVCEAGGMGFLGAGMQTPQALAGDIATTRALTDRPFGINLFVPSGLPEHREAVAAYGHALGPEAGAPRYDDDDQWEAKLRLVADERPAVCSFTFALPSAEVIGRLQERGIAVWVTVTSAAEARAAAEAGADALVVQGTEAGGHRGSFTDAPDDTPLIDLLGRVAAATDLPLIAAGGIAIRADVEAVLAAGAVAAQAGTAFLLADEAGTNPLHRRMLTERARRTQVTRAYTGRRARGLVNEFMITYGDDAPVSYPAVLHVTAPIRAAAAARDDVEWMNLWAGQRYQLAEALPAAEITRRLLG